MDKNLILLLAYGAYLVFMSLVAIVLYGKDKSNAQGGKGRIKEKTLLWVVCLGGAFGGSLGRILFHHKTNKIYFSIVITLSLFLQIALLGVLIYFVVR